MSNPKPSADKGKHWRRGYTQHCTLELTWSITQLVLYCRKSGTDVIPTDCDGTQHTAQAAHKERMGQVVGHGQYLGKELLATQQLDESNHLSLGTA